METNGTNEQKGTDDFAAPESGKPRIIIKDSSEALKMDRFNEHQLSQLANIKEKLNSMKDLDRSGSLLSALSFFEVFGDASQTDKAVEYLNEQIAHAEESTPGVE